MAAVIEKKGISLLHIEQSVYEVSENIWMEIMDKLNLELFVVEYHKSATPKAGQIKRHITRSQWEVKIKTKKLQEARKNTRDQEVSCFCLNLIGS